MSQHDAWIDALTQGTQEFGASARKAAQHVGETNITKKAQDLVRLALFHEYERTPIRRDHIIKHIVGKEASRAFPIIFSQAQNILRTTFAFELVEARGRGTENPLLTQQEAALDERVGSKRRRTDETVRKASTSTHTYILRSTLPLDILKVMASDESGDPVLDWDTSEGELGTMGLLFVVLGIILVSGRQAPDTRIRACLAQVSLSIDRVMPISLQPLESGTSDHASRHTLDMFFQRAMRQGYLERVRAADTSQQTSALEWRWGPRSEVEMGEHAVASFMAELYGQIKSESSEPSVSILKRIERAAGTSLVG